MGIVSAYGVTEPGGRFSRLDLERRELDPNDVLIKIAYAGICHSDIHTVRGEWGQIHFPMVPGHEIAGIVEAVGSEVTKHQVGDRVGVGCFVDSCRECENCKDGWDNYCLNGSTGTYNGVDKYGMHTAGGYSTHIVVDENYTLRIPDGIGLDVAAPLLCAGITMYSPLAHWGAGPGRQVGIVGLGGLGHVGVKIARAMGADVTILTRSRAKEADAARLGASRFVATAEPDALRDLRNTFDLVVNTISSGIDVSQYLATLRLHGTMVNVGVPTEPYRVPFGSLAGGQKSLAASAIGSIKETQEMLDFCATHGIGADIELIGADEIDEAYDRVVASDVRYRFVIDAATFAG
jgi:alcohol dehydrogenase (NADP+)